jgi:PII-like signaling protein
MSTEHYTGETLRIFLSEGDQHNGRPLYDVLIETARREGLSGGTVFRGREGFGAHGEVHTTSILRLADKLPVVVEFVGRTEKIEAYLKLAEPMLKEGLVTRHHVQITKIRET